MKYLLLLLLLSPIVSYAEVTPLPELGDSSASSLSPEQERQIGREMVRRMRQSGYIISDPLITSFVEQVGLTLSTHTDTAQKFTFFVVDAPSINAFALPGGYIGVHTGLILASQSESELASVLAHEIAHVTQHHLARGVEQANRMQLPLTLGLIAAILLSGGDPDIANAAMAASLGGSQQMQLNFTRAHEHEADRVGMKLLAHSEFNPHGMADFFSRLQDESRYYGEGVPEFLRTHPVTTTRLAEAEAAAEHYPRKMRVDSSAYQVAKARIQLHHTKDPVTLKKELLAKESHSTEPAIRYLLALTYQALQQTGEAIRLLQSLVNEYPNSIAYRETLGQALALEGEHSKAVTLYNSGLKRFPNNEVLTLSLSSNLIALKRYPKAREHINNLLRRNSELAAAYNLLSELEFNEGKNAAAHLAKAEYYKLLGEPHSALEQLKVAKRVDNLDFYIATRIEALDKEIEENLEAERNLLK